MSITTRLLTGHFSMKATQNSATHTRHSLFSFVFLQASVLKLFEKHTTIRMIGISGLRKWWQYYRSISIGWISDKILGSTSDLALLVPLPKQPSRSKASIPHYLPLVDLGNPSPWIRCCAFILLSMEMTVFFLSSTGSQIWSLWRPTRKISQ